MPGTVSAHYGSEQIVERILAAISPDEPLPTSLRPEQIFPFDQLHGRELAATSDHVAALISGNRKTILDIGSGIGGPARYVCAHSDTSVDGVDITPEFVRAATVLTKMCGLGDRARFHLADAARLPFGDTEFDGACCLYVGMNLAAPELVLSEAFRVLKPGARLVWTEAVLTGKGDPIYPQPWAIAAEQSHLVNRSSLEAMIMNAGFVIDQVTDETDAHIELARQRQAQGGAIPEPVMQVNRVVLGPDFVERRMNYIKSLASGALASLVIDAHRP